MHAWSCDNSRHVNAQAVLSVDRCGLRVGYVCEEGQGKARKVEYRELELDAETL
jgi:hypothetical protein